MPPWNKGLKGDALKKAIVDRTCACDRGMWIKPHRHCRACENERINRWRQANPTYHRNYSKTVSRVKDKVRYKADPEYRAALIESRRRYRYLMVYEITVEQFDKMMELQGGLCKICRQGPKTEKSRLHVDHCHDSNRVRGLLCYDCNKHRVGKARDHEAPLYLRVYEYVASDFDGRKL